MDGIVGKGGMTEAIHGIFTSSRAATPLLAREAEAVVAGCTEVPLLLRDGDLSVPVIDPTTILTRAAVRRARGQDSRLASSQRCYKDRG
jgi:aspartate/glutamate racemase